MFITPLYNKVVSLKLNPVNRTSNQAATMSLKTLRQDEVSFTGKTHNDAPPNGFEIKGRYTNAFVYSSDVDYQAYNQIKKCCDHPVFKDAQIRVMPDVHAGKANVVGFSAKMQNDCAFIPSIIGGDIGCGMLCVKIDTKGKPLDFKKLDKVIRKYISGKNIESTAKRAMPLSFERRLNEVTKRTSGENASAFQHELGTLGGGNHFIEIDQNEKGEFYLVIHSGSKNLGKSVHDYYQSLAEETNPYPIKEMSYLTGASAKEYFESLKVAKEYAQLNRKVMANIILSEMGWKPQSQFESIHNYISDDFVVRKGAISAEEGQSMIIPINMKDGAIIATGKGNDDWNSTAPHGAGRKFSRGEAKERLSFEDYESSMTGIYSTCITPKTITESPQAYRSIDEIAENIDGTAEIQEVITPIYNFKG